MAEQIVKGSLAQIAKDNNKSIAQTFLSCDVIVIVDTSGSMGSLDSRDGQSRYKVACNELARLQGTLPGKIAVISFSNTVLFCPSGVPFNLDSGTHMDKALDFARVADVPDMRFILISDGEPTDESSALTAARKYKNKIDTIYVGPENEKAGQDFLKRLAKASGGQALQDFKVNALGSNIQKLLA